MIGSIPLAEIPIGEGRTVVVAGEQVAVFRLRDGGVRALGARCPHAGGPLADGLLDDRVVVCPLHNRSYDLITGVETGGDEPVTAWDADVDAQAMVCITARVASTTVT